MSRRAEFYNRLADLLDEYGVEIHQESDGYGVEWVEFVWSDGHVSEHLYCEVSADDLRELSEAS